MLARSAFDNAKDVFEQRAAAKLIQREFGTPPGWLQTMNQSTGTGKKLATTIGLVSEAYGQKVPKGGIDAREMTQSIRDQIEPPKEEGLNIPGVGTFRNPLRRPGDQSSLPTAPAETGLQQIRTAQNYETLFPQDPLGAAISRRRMI